MRWDPVHDGRAAFLACMRAMCSPGTPVELPSTPQLSERPALDGAAAILLALLDRGLTLGISGDAAAEQVGARLVEQSGADRGEVAQADWILVHGPAGDAIASARQGTPLAPETGATVVIAAAGDPVPLWLLGPGLPGRTRSAVPIDEVAVRAFTAANANGPCGVDVLVATAKCVIALPRSVTVGVG